MPMQMGFRWYGEGNDAITLNHIKQIPGVTSIVWALHHKLPGEIWEEAEIAEVMDQLHAYGFNGDVVESVNVHDDIKIGLPTRDGLIENYKQCIRNLGKFGVKVICYNFMPIFDWTRSNLFHEVGDGSTALFYEKGMIQDDYNAMAKYILDFTEKYNMSFPGWEPERMAKLAVEMGAKFIVSPGFSDEVVGWCVENGIPVAPGCVTPTEIMAALKHGLTMVKFFPANVYGGLNAMKNLSAPFVGLKFLPTGGVNTANIKEYVDAPFIHAVGGSWVCPKADILAHNWGKITNLCREARQAAKGE